MSHTFLCLLTVGVAFAADATVSCTGASCSTCVGTAAVQVCANYTSPPVTCTLPCSNACPASPTCQACVSTGVQAGLGSAAAYVGVCITTNTQVAAILTSSASVGADVNLQTLANAVTSITNVAASASATAVAGSSIVTLNGGTVSSLTLGSGSSSDTSIVTVNASVTVTEWISNAATTSVQSSASITVANLSVSGTSVAFFQSGSSASLDLPMIDFSASGSFTGAGTLAISGGSATIGASGSASGSITGTGNLDVSGGASIQGSTPSSVTVNVEVEGQAAPLVAVDAGKTWNINGQVMGSSGTVAVNGQLYLGAAVSTVQPQVVVNNAGTLVVNTSTSLTSAAWSIGTGATVVIGSSVNGANLMVTNFQQCLGNVQINLAMTASAFISSSAAGVGTAFTYGSNVNYAQLAKCGVTVIDSTGKSFTLTSTAAASAGRRLLASSGSATWGQNSMTYNMNGAQSNDAASPYTVLPLAVAGLVALMA